MWKWLAVASVLYGVFCMLAVLSPRSRALTAALDLQAMAQAWQSQGAPPLIHDFETHQPPPVTIPPALTELAVDKTGNRYLRWRPPPGPQAAVLGLPVRYDEAANAALILRVRAEGVEQLFVGVREGDGSVYATQLPADRRWQLHRLPLKRLMLSPRTEDENGQLDPTQINAIIVAAIRPPEPPERRRQHRDRPPPEQLIELDDVGFKLQP